MRRGSSVRSAPRAEDQVGMVTSRHEGRLALEALCAPLLAAGLLPASIPKMDPRYLAAGTRGVPGVVVASVAGRPIAYLAYIRRTAMYPVGVGPISVRVLPHRALHIVGYRGSASDPAPVLARQFDELRLLRWHVLYAYELSGGDPLTPHLAGMLADAGSGIRGAVRSDDTWQVAIAGSFESYLARRFSAKTRFNLRREVQKFETQTEGRGRVKVYTREDEVDAFLADAERIARRTYQWHLGFATVRTSAHTRRNLSYLARQRQLRSYVLYVDDVPCAYCLGSIAHGELIYDVVGYDPRFARLNPGKVLLYRILGDLFETGAARCLDFGVGPADYKRLFATDHREVFSVRFFRRAALSGLLRVSAAVSDAGWASIGPAVRLLKRRVKRWAGRIGGRLSVMTTERSRPWRR
jgi:Acetyltransferase (GNAT) domain